MTINDARTAKSPPPLQRRRAEDSDAQAGNPSGQQETTNAPRVPRPADVVPPIHRPAVMAVTELRCEVAGSWPFVEALAPKLPWAAGGRKPSVTGHAVLIVGAASRMDELEAQTAAHMLVECDSVTVRGTDPEGVHRIEGVLGAAMEVAADEAHLEMVSRIDLSGTGGT